MRFLPVLAVVCLCVLPTSAQDVYQKPSKAVLDVLNAPAPPVPSVNPVQTVMALATPRRYPPISEVSQTFLRLAGVRINPRNSGPHLPPTFTGLHLIRLRDGLDSVSDLPPNPRLSMPVWSPDGELFAFLNYKADTIDLWVGESSNAKAKQVPGIRVNAAFGEPIRWMPGSQTLLVQTVPASRGRVPAISGTPKGPRIQEGSGKAAPVRTYQDLLINAQDEALFEYYATSQLVMVEVSNGKTTPVGKPAIYHSMDPSPDGKYLLITRLHAPFSYQHPHTSFPRDVEVWDRSGRMVKQVASLPLADTVPIDGVATGPRDMTWRNDSSTLVWVEAMDGGNPKEKVPHRDRIVALKAPFTGEPSEVFETEHRFRDMEWGDKGLALVRDYDRDRRWIRTYMVDVDQKQQAKVLFERSFQDRYRDPGLPRMTVLGNGRRVLQQIGDDIFLVGEGASPKGDRPFLDRMNLVTGKKERLFQSAADRFERPIAILDKEGKRIVIERESPTEPPNYYVVAEGSEPKALTHYKDPTPQLRAITKQLVTYKRPDGVQLSFTLYLPPGYQKGTPLPTIVWAYPREFNDPDTAGQIVGSTQRFTSITGPSHLFFLLAGYAVLDDATMPVVGSPEVANNTYVEQIVASAKAAIDKAAEMGVTDPKRVGVGGHSYGAFMTANLLAHSDLFRAGVARSGAYNRTLTPFGFQNERRTFWESPDLYLKMSPFVVADKIKTPILLIHGEADNNPGTFPIQSERMYTAVRGNGGTIRYVTLPFEAHGYVGRESVEHTLYEMIRWFDKWVKGADSGSGDR